MNYISFIDIFGVQFRQQISYHVKSQKSLIGGITSLIILIASFGYLAYILHEWISFNLLPKLTNTMMADQTSELLYFEDESLFEFAYWKYSNKQVDPFSQQNNIITPIGIYFDSDQESQKFSFLNQNEKLSNFGTKKYGLNQLRLSQSSKGINVRELMIVFVKCNPLYLSANQSCASETEIDSFFTSAVNYFQFELNLKQFNSQTQQIETFKKSYYFSLDKVIATQSQISFKQAQASIDNGILFASLTKETFVQDAQILTTSSSLGLWQDLLEIDSYFTITLRLDPISNELHIVYPKIGEVLAQVGSIVNVLMMLKYIVSYYNEKILDKCFIDQVLSFYFTDYKQLHKSKADSDKKACSILVEQAQKRLVYINIIYELSRIQMFLQHHFGRKKLQESHSLGILLKPPNTNLNQDFEQELISNSQEHSDEENKAFLIKDFLLFSQPNLCLNQVENDQANKQNSKISPQQNFEQQQL
ncbi:unnamed protein product (macronuclear) [Paramecium tetraurelia]|uniref:Transmembrane protein n=1 Tax=Paramecium tetraurelia TaxID=5888 RepID=A0E6A3_PARTE|nr:uncharacterized protein GSPATT00003685001 [Paramecium tetraurelia]CAK90820.1 unnamed protein product [Paramecium tetraurelia]|eukprot:XP_001458217.1 hypothetical protein (macronuclear) [Paramecium tetraurelia strain d4-2]